MSRFTQIGALAAGALALGVMACGDGSGPSTTSDVLTVAQAQDLGQAVAEDVVEMIDGSGYDPNTGVYMATEGTADARGYTPPPPCITLSPNPPANSDGDVVPDSVRFTYDCGFQRANGNLIDSLTGSIDFIDPLPQAASVGARHRFTDFTRKRINVPFPLRSFVAVHNGEREWGGNADTLGHTITNFVSAWRHPSGRQTTHEKDWVGKFTAATAGTITVGLPLPAGSWTVNGTSAWTSGLRTWSAQVTTTEPMVYDPTCPVPPRLTDGTVELVVTRNTVVTNVTIEFTACGQYTVTRTPGQ